jgi:hypothetical protein
MKLLLAQFSDLKTKAFVLVVQQTRINIGRLHFIYSHYTKFIFIAQIWSTNHSFFYKSTCVYIWRQQIFIKSGDTSCNLHYTAQAWQDCLPLCLPRLSILKSYNDVWQLYFIHNINTCTVFLNRMQSISLSCTEIVYKFKGYIIFIHNRSKDCNSLYTAPAWPAYLPLHMHSLVNLKGYTHLFFPQCHLHCHFLHNVQAWNIYIFCYLYEGNVYIGEGYFLFIHSRRIACTLFRHKTQTVFLQIQVTHGYESEG